MRLDIVIFVVLCVALVYSVYTLYFLLPKQTEIFIFNPVEDISYAPLKVPITYNETQQFYRNMRFSKMPITYYIDYSCDYEKINRMKNAFRLLENITILKFQEENTGEIAITCSNETPIKGGDMFIAGEGGPTSIIDTNEYNIIQNGTILLFKTSECDKPLVEIHELFHVLGFDHSPNPQSVMFNKTNCNQQITQDIIDKLNSLYATESLPNIYFETIIANKTGRYLNFQLSIGNEGLANAEKSVLNIYADNEKIKEIDIDPIEIGYKRVLTIENLRVPYKFSNLTFIIDEENKIKELDKTNNIATLSIKED